MPAVRVTSAPIWQVTVAFCLDPLRTLAGVMQKLHTKDQFLLFTSVSGRIVGGTEDTVRLFGDGVDLETAEIPISQLIDSSSMSLLKKLAEEAHGRGASGTKQPKATQIKFQNVSKAYMQTVFKLPVTASVSHTTTVPPAAQVEDAAARASTCSTASGTATTAPEARTSSVDTGTSTSSHCDPAEVDYIYVNATLQVTSFLATGQKSERLDGESYA